MAKLDDVEWLDPLVEEKRNPELERFLSDRVGSGLAGFRYVAGCPWIAQADVEFDIGLAHLNDLSQRIYLVVSRDNACRYCHGASRLFLRMAGMSDTQIDRLEEDIDAARGEPRTQRAFDYARRISRAKPPPSERDRAELRELGYSDDAIRELALFTGVVIFHNRYSTLLALPVNQTERASRNGLFVRVLRFLFRRVRKSLDTPGTHAPIGSAMGEGPYGFLTARLDGLPHGAVLRRVLDDAWASPHLTPRTRSLIFAVVARGLGSDASEREARRLLEGEGLSATAIDESLASLSSAELTPEERRILPYARETLWYEPATAQRRGKELRERLENDVFVDTVGTAALANMVCRVALALGPTE